MSLLCFFCVVLEPSLTFKLRTGRTAESMGNWSRALASYETALRHSPHNVDALTQTASIFRQQERFIEAIDYFTRVVALNDRNGDVWGYLGHCYLMVDDTIKAYACYQQAILHMPDSKVSSVRKHACPLLKHC